MAIAASPITNDRNLLDLLRQIVPPEERAVELYRRLLSINVLSSSMNSSKDLSAIRGLLAAYFREYLSGESISLCIRDGNRYKKYRLSGSDGSGDADGVPLGNGIARSALKSPAPLWIPDVYLTRKIRRFAGVPSEELARSILVIPFSVQGRVIGCLEMLSNSPNRLDELEYHLGLLVAAHISCSLENIMTRQELTAANVRLKDHDCQVTQMNEQLKQLAHTDECTGLFNKRRLFEHLGMEIARARRYGEVFSCLMLDIDNFKRINDTYGHQAGDEILRQIGSLLRRSLRVSDFVARYGGEEFTVVLPRTSGAGAFRAAQNLLSTFMSHEFIIPAASVYITASIGVACCTTFDQVDADRIIQRADEAMYRAKQSGKNRICFADEIGAAGAESQDFVIWMKPA